MREIDRPLAWLARRLRPLPGARRLIRPLQHYFARHYSTSDVRWTVMEDFDRDLRLHVNRAGYMASSIFWNGYYSLNEAAVMIARLEPESVVIDAGAHMGELTLLAAKRCPRGKVLAIEPTASVFALLLRNVDENGFRNVECLQLALSEGPGELNLYGGTPDASLGFDDDVVLTTHAGYGRTSRVESVACVALDVLVEERGFARVDFLKIDVEGAELSVLRGAQQTLARFGPDLIVEVTEPLLAQGGHSGREIFELLEGLGYRAYLITDHGLGDALRARSLQRYGKLVSVDAASAPSTANIFFTRR